MPAYSGPVPYSKVYVSRSKLLMRFQRVAPKIALSTGRSYEEVVDLFFDSMQAYPPSLNQKYDFTMTGLEGKKAAYVDFGIIDQTCLI